MAFVIKTWLFPISIWYTVIDAIKEYNMRRLPDKAYYSPEEVADYLDVTPDTIRKLCRAGEIQGARQVGRQWRIPRSYLEEQPTIHIAEENEQKH